jgi:hypothetical protein
VTFVKVLRVGTALDTNGQGYRFHKAAERYGDDPEVLKALIIGLYDPADVGGRFREAAKKIGTLSIRSAHSSEAYFDFPNDLRWTRANHLEIQALADECDVIHLNNSPKAYYKLKMAKVRKPALLHHHGTLFRNNPEPLLYDARRFHMVQAVSTIDLLRHSPDTLHWLPTAYDLEELGAIRTAHRRKPDGLVRVVSAPTNPELKSTEKLKAAVAQLQAEALPVELVIVANKTWRECLEVKATADIYFDQVAVPALEYPGGYGCNAIEAWGMGIPVVAGADEWTTARMRQEWNLKPNQPLPFVEATEDTIGDAIAALVLSTGFIEEAGNRGRVHARTYHAEKPALKRLAELYGLAIATMQEAGDEEIVEFPLKPGTFATTLKPSLVVPIGNQQIRFREGRATVENPEMAQKMRQAIRYRPRFQLSEVMEDAG